MYRQYSNGTDLSPTAKITQLWTQKTNTKRLVEVSENKLDEHIKEQDLVREMAAILKKMIFYHK